MTAALATEYVVIVDGAEKSRHEKRDSASKATRRAAAKGADARFVTAEEWAAEEAARHEAEAAAVAAEALAAMEAETAAAEVVEAPKPARKAKAKPAAEKAPKAPLRGQGTPADLRHADLKAKARKLTLVERRALAARVHETVHALLAEMCATAEAGEYAGTDLADVSAADLEVTAGNWMWHVPGGGLEWGQNR